VADDLVDHLVVQHRRNLVDAVSVERGNHRFRLNVGEQRDFRPFVRRQWPVGAT
jgi:hypothetical protein